MRQCAVGKPSQLRSTGQSSCSGFGRSVWPWRRGHIKPTSWQRVVASAALRRPTKPIQDDDDDIDPDEAQFLATYGDLIDDDDALSNFVEARKQQAAASASRSDRMQALADVASMSGLGSVGIMREVLEEEARLAREELRQLQREGGSTYLLQQQLAEEGYDLESDWAALEERKSTTGAAKSGPAIRGPSGEMLLAPPSNPKIAAQRREAREARRRRRLFSDDSDLVSGPGSWSGGSSSDDDAWPAASVPTPSSSGSSLTAAERRLQEAGQMLSRMDDVMKVVGPGGLLDGGVVYQRPGSASSQPRRYKSVADEDDDLDMIDALERGEAPSVSRGGSRRTGGDDQDSELADAVLRRMQQAFKAATELPALSRPVPGSTSSKPSTAAPGKQASKAPATRSSAAVGTQSSLPSWLTEVHLDLGSAQGTSSRGRSAGDDEDPFQLTIEAAPRPSLGARPARSSPATPVTSTGARAASTSGRLQSTPASSSQQQRSVPVKPAGQEELDEFELQWAAAVEAARTKPAALERPVARPAQPMSPPAETSVAPGTKSRGQAAAHSKAGSVSSSSSSSSRRRNSYTSNARLDALVAQEGSEEEEEEVGDGGDSDFDAAFEAAVASARQKSASQLSLSQRPDRSDGAGGKGLSTAGSASTAATDSSTPAWLADALEQSTSSSSRSSGKSGNTLTKMTPDLAPLPRPSTTKPAPARPGKALSSPPAINSSGSSRTSQPPPAPIRPSRGAVSKPGVEGSSKPSTTSSSQARRESSSRHASTNGGASSAPGTGQPKPQAVQPVNKPMVRATRNSSSSSGRGSG